MNDESYNPSKAEHLAGIVTKNAGIHQTMATVQRSHRFPLYIFNQIENMAQMGGVPVSLIINQLLECGLDAVMAELPEDVATNVKMRTEEQTNQPSEIERVIVEYPRKSPRAKPKPIK